MRGFTLTELAKADLKEIGRYTEEQWGRDQRSYYLAMLNSCFQDIAANPLKGKDCSDVRIGYRKINAGSHVIYYRQVSEETVQIVRVLHGRMDVETRLEQL